jgi:hypothetical protein
MVTIIVSENMGCNTNTEAGKADSEKSKIAENRSQGCLVHRPLSKDIPADLNRDITVELKRCDEEVLIIDNEGEFQETGSGSTFRLSVEHAGSKKMIPGLNVRAVFTRRNDGEEFGPYNFPLLCCSESISYGKELEIPEGSYDLKVFIRPNGRYSWPKDVVGEVKAVFTQVEID